MLSHPSHALRRRYCMEVEGGVPALLRGLASQMYQAAEEPSDEDRSLLGIAEHWLRSPYARSAAGRSLALASTVLRASLAS